MLKQKLVGFIGAGKMCEAILAGALRAGVLAAENTTVTDTSEERLAYMRKTYAVGAVLNEEGGSGPKQLAASCDILLLCVKPQLLPTVLGQLSGAGLSRRLVISIVGGVPLATLEAALPDAAVIRTMPNTPMLVQHGVAGISPGKNASSQQIAQCRALFDAVGESYLVDEALIDPLTAVSGCGPAFACLFIEALADGGVEQGLPRQLALRLAAQTLAGTGQMVLQTGQHPAALKDDVCSPGGGTIAGVHALEDGAFRASIINAVEAARRRMRQLGAEPAKNKEET